MCNTFGPRLKSNGGGTILAHHCKHERMVYHIEGLLEVYKGNPCLMSMFFSDLQGGFQVEDSVYATFPFKVAGCFVNTIATDEGIHLFCSDGGHHLVSDVEETDGSPVLRGEGGHLS